MRRRRFLGLAGGGVLGVAGGVAVDNVLLGYGRVSGTNLQEQDLEAVLNDGLGPPGGRAVTVDGTAVELAAGGLRVGDDALPWSADGDEVATVEADHGLHRGSLGQLVADIPRIRAGDHTVVGTSADAFFDRAATAATPGRSAATRPHTVESLRGPRVRDVRPSLVREFVGADPADPEAVAYGLVDAFREHTFYDAPRYVAGAIEDNVLRKTVDLREPFDSSSGFRAMLDGENRGTFCYDYVYRSMEAFHAVPAVEQRVPVVAAYVRDARHKHAYTALATVLREDDAGGSDAAGSGSGSSDAAESEGDGELTLIVTFLDYTPTTTAHSFGVTRAVGDDPNAYTSRHRATEVRWNRRTYT